MTPFGEEIRRYRKERGISQKKMAQDLEVSPAYLSALEHGHRGAPSWALVQNIIRYFNIIWDEAEALEQLARISHPRIVVDTAGLSSQATKLVNELARTIKRLPEEKIETLLKTLHQGQE